MLAAAEALEFEQAAALRDRIMQMREFMGQKLGDVRVEPYQPRGRRRRTPPVRKCHAPSDDPSEPGTGGQPGRPTAPRRHDRRAAVGRAAAAPRAQQNGATGGRPAAA